MGMILWFGDFVYLCFLSILQNATLGINGSRLRITSLPSLRAEVCSLFYLLSSVLLPFLT